MNRLDTVEKTQLRENIPAFQSGDTVKVHVRIKEGNKERLQVFEGVVSVAELVTKVETFDMVECFNAETDICTLSPSCRLKTMLKKATKSFLKELSGYTIEDLA